MGESLTYIRRMRTRGLVFDRRARAPRLVEDCERFAYVDQFGVLILGDREAIAFQWRTASGRQFRRTRRVVRDGSVRVRNDLQLRIEPTTPSCFRGTGNGRRGDTARCASFRGRRRPGLLESSKEEFDRYARV